MPSKGAFTARPGTVLREFTISSLAVHVRKMSATFKRLRMALVLRPLGYLYAVKSFRLMRKLIKAISKTLAIPSSRGVSIGPSQDLKFITDLCEMRKGI